MPAYVTAQLEVTNPETFGKYREVAGEALAKHGAKILVAGRSETLHEAGLGTTPSVLIEFADADAARAWINDPELTDVHALRNGGAKVTLTLLDLAA